ncbi:MAG: 4-hydroxybenzoate octaprenyltransferase [Pseudomonadota bacterium]
MTQSQVTQSQGQPTAASSPTTPPGERVHVADAPARNLFERFAPAAALPFGQLARFDRPIGAWLLLMPCWWSLTLGEMANGAAYPNLWFAFLFMVGAFVMRGAGCTYNDLVDHDYDGRVARTALRPLPSGRVTRRQAAIFMVGLCLIGLLVLVQFNTLTIWLAIASLGLVALYPFMKRFTYWPQLILGLTFKWGALVGWTAARGEVAWPALILYAGCVCWTIGYDTIYAHQDKEDDLMLGLKSTALRFGAKTRAWVGAFYIVAWSAWTVAAALSGAHLIAFLGLALAACHMAWQVATLDTEDGDNCLIRFKSNRDLGFIVLGGYLADMGVTALVA